MLKLFLLIVKENINISHEIKDKMETNNVIYSPTKTRMIILVKTSKTDSKKNKISSHMNGYMKLNVIPGLIQKEKVETDTRKDAQMSIAARIIATQG